jgi:hypothetical protein
MRWRCQFRHRRRRQRNGRSTPDPGLGRFPVDMPAAGAHFLLVAVSLLSCCLTKHRTRRELSGEFAARMVLIPLPRRGAAARPHGSFHPGRLLGVHRGGLAHPLRHCRRSSGEHGHVLSRRRASDSVFGYGGYAVRAPERELVADRLLKPAPGGRPVKHARVRQLELAKAELVATSRGGDRRPIAATAGEPPSGEGTAGAGYTSVAPLATVCGST